MIALIATVALILLNGILAMSELAVVSSRKSRLAAMVEDRRAGAASALKLAENPGRFLSTVQIGITLVGILAGAVSGAALGERLAALLLEAGLPASVAEPLAFVVVIGGVTYLSVVIGELVPKNIALRDPERFACLLAPPMTALSKVAAPVVWLLDTSTRLVFRLLGQKEIAENTVTEDEIRTLVAEAANAGVIEGQERHMISGILRLGDRSVGAIMTPRVDVEWLDLASDPSDARQTLLEARHAWLPVIEGDADDVIGVINVREALARLLISNDTDLRELVREPFVLPDVLDALTVLERLRASKVPIALVHDEYGHFDGVVTPADVLEAVTGAFLPTTPGEDPEAMQREDGSWLLAGSLSADEMADLLGIDLPGEREFETVAGFVISVMERIPGTGDVTRFAGWRFEIVDLDGRRVDKVLASRDAGST